MDLMIDIETMSLHHSNALVLSVGALPFTLKEAGPQFGTPCIWVLDLVSQIAAGREVSKDTAAFWAKPENATASNHWRTGSSVQIAQFCNELTKLYSSECAGGSVWANGIVFDIGNILSLLELVDFKVPWKYNAVQDARTFYKLDTVRQVPNDVEDTLAHHPLGDCKAQVWRLWERAKIMPETQAKEGPK